MGKRVAGWGNTYPRPARLPRMNGRGPATGRPRHPDVLTPAEWDVLAGVREGLRNDEIAARRGSSIETVRYHLRNVRQKLRLRNRDALRAWPGRPAVMIDAAPEEPSDWRIREQIPLLAVQEMERVLAFYIERLGFDLVARWPDAPEPPGWVALASGAARLMLHAGHHRREVHATNEPGPVTLSLYVDGLDALHESLRTAGLSPTEIRRTMYGARECYLNDPEGNEIALVEFRASDPGYLAEDGPRGGSA